MAQILGAKGINGYQGQLVGPFDSDKDVIQQIVEEESSIVCDSIKKLHIVTPQVAIISINGTDFFIEQNKDFIISNIPIYSLYFKDIQDGLNYTSKNTVLDYVLDDTFNQTQKKYSFIYSPSVMQNNAKTIYQDSIARASSF